MEILVNVPDQYLVDEDPKAMADRLKLSAALLLFQQGQLSAGAACEMAGIDRFAFYEACRKYKIPVVDFPPEDLDHELRWLTGGA